MAFLGDIGKAFEQIGGGALRVVPGIGDAIATNEANKANKNEAKVNREFQERMSSTAYQRAMEDMKKAGLNPMLAYMQGGASAPAGAQAQHTPATATKLGEFGLQMATGISGIGQRATALQQQETMNESSIQLNAANAAKSIADAEKIRTETKGLGRKEGEGKLWKRFYDGVNSVLDNSAKSAKEANKRQKPLIKKKGDLPKGSAGKGISDFFFNQKD